jgi:rhodanese-related sulfurtransferase
MQGMNPRQVYEYLEITTNKPLLLDVRENGEYGICHIKGSELIPMQTIPNQLD